MHRLKRIAVVFMVLLLMLGTACSTGNKENTSLTGHLNPKTPVTVTLWHYYVGENQQALESAVSDFNETVGMEKGVIVESIAMGSIAELEESVTNSAMGVLNAQPMPQLFSSYPDKALEIDALNMLTELSGYFTDEEKGLYVADFLADGIFDENRMLLVPIVKSTELMYVNATAWDAFAAAQGYTNENLSTWESLLDTSRAYYEWTRADVEDIWSGKGFMGFDSVANYAIIGSKQLGVNVIDADAGENGQAVLNRDALRRVFDIYSTGMSMGYFNAIGRFRSDDIKAGELVSYVGSSSSAAYFPTWIEKDNAQSPISFAALPYPVFEGGKSYAIQQGAGMCVAKSTPAQQEGAVVFLKWFTDSAQNIPFAMTTGYLPVQQSAYGSEAFNEALDSLRAGDEALQNVASVYDIALYQITESNTYAATPFSGSYDVRSTLQSTLIASAEESKAAADVLKAEGKTEAEILEALDMDARFDAWLADVQSRLTELGIEYTL